MKKLFISFICFFFFLNSSFACAPYFYSEIVVGEYKGKIEDILLPWENTSYDKIQFIDLGNPQRLYEGMDLTIGEFLYEYDGPETILKYPFSEMGKYFFSPNDRINFDVYKEGDILLMISASNNGDLPEYYMIYEAGKLVCNNGKLSIEKKEGAINSFGKEMWWCGNHKPNDVMTEKELLQKIEEKFSICEKLNQNQIEPKKNNNEGLDEAKNISENSNTTEIWLLLLLLSIFVIIFLVRLRTDN